MVAVVSGSGLGLFTGTGLNGNGQVGRGRDQIIVNTTNGNLVVQSVDETLTALGLDFAGIRTYNSQGLTDEDNGDNWRLGVHQRLLNIPTGTFVDGSTSVTKVFGDGAEVIYIWSAARTRFESKHGDGANDFLTWDSANARWTWTDGSSRVTETYESVSGVFRIRTSRDADLNTVTYNYTGSLLTNITMAGSTSQQVFFEYTGTNLTAIRVESNGSANAQTLTRYRYDSLNRLQQVIVDLTPKVAGAITTDLNSDQLLEGVTGESYVTTYTYEGTSKRVASIAQTDGSSVLFTYLNVNGDYRLNTVRDAENRTTTFNYLDVTGSGPVVYQRTEVLDALGAMTTYLKDPSGRLVAVLRSSSSGTLETRYDYDTATGNLWHITEDPTGLNRITTFEYDPNTGLLLTMRDPLGNTVTRTYNSNNQLSTETTYTAPDPDGVGPGVPGGPMVTRYVYDFENHLRFVVSADGRVTEHQYNADGLRLLTFNHLATTYGGVYDETNLASWTTGAGAGVRERIDYRYDWRGSIDRLTRWETTDASGVGTGTSSITQFVYDQRGQLLQRIDPRGSGTAPVVSTPNENQAFSTTYLYDGLGRVQRAVEWLDGPEIASGRVLRTRVRTTAYDDFNRYTTVQLVGGLSTLSVFDRAGGLVRVEAAGIITARYAYDGGGRLRIATDATGVRQFSFYDSANRLIGTVDGDGTVTELIYDKASQLIKTVQHSTLLSSATLATLVDASGNPTSVTFGSLLTLVGTSDATDKVTRRVYDNAGRLVYSIDEIGAVTKFTYDGANRLVEELLYRNTFTSIARATDQVLPAAITVAEQFDDRRTRHFYDNSGNRIATLDAEGYLTENTFDNAGHLITRFERANPVSSTPASLRLSGTLDQLRTSAGTDTETTTDPEVDITTQYYYDMQGRLAGVLDGESYFTRTNYDVAGNVLSTVRYRNRTNLAGRPTLTSITSAVSAMPSHTTTRQYDGAGRQLSEVSFESTRTEYEYDNLDNVVSVRTAAGSTDERYALARYDNFGRLIRELSGEGRVALAALPGGATQTQIDDVWNRFGVLYGYDDAGRRTTATIRPNATQTLVTRYYYDNDGRLRFEVNHLGERKEYRYDAFGQLTESIKYFGTISTSGLNGGLLTSSLLGTLAAGADTTRDAKTSHTYTLRGQLNTSQTQELATATRSYNAFGELDSEILGTGFAATTFTYTHRGQLAETFRNGVSFEKREYDAFGRLTKVTDGRGKISRTEYDRLGRTIAIVDPFLLRNTIDYDGYSRVTQSDDATAGTNLTIYTYDDVALTTTVDTPAGVRVVTTHNRQNETWTVTVAATASPSVFLDSKTYLYDKNGALRFFYDDGTKVEERTYDQGGRLETTIDTRGTVTRIEYDAASRVYREIVDSVSGGLQLTTTHLYDGLGRPTDVTDARGTLTRTSYDRDGRVIEVAVDPSGLNLRTRYAYDTLNNTTLVTEGYGTSLPRRTRYVYDNLGRRVEEIIDPTVDGGTLNLRTQYKYDNNDNVTRQIDSRGFSTWYVYDDKNRLTHEINAIGGVTLTTYDEMDRLASTRRFVVALSGANLTTLASLDSPTTANFTMPVTSTNDRFERSFYDKDGREKYSIDGVGVVTQRDYDALGEVTRLRVLSGPRLTGTYANTDAVTSALGTAADTLAVLDRVTWNTYDTLGRLEWAIDSTNGIVGRVQRFFRDGNGNVIELRSYANTRTLGLATDLTTMRSWGTANSDAAVDQFTRFWFDRADRARFTLDSEGYLTEVRYNDANRTTTSIAYVALQTGVRNLASGADVSLVPGALLTDATRDQVTVKWSDAAGRTRLVRDAEGYVTQARYNDQTGAQETITYAEKPTTAPVESTALSTALGYLVTTAARDRRSMSWIDAAGRQRFTVDGEGYAVETRYDDVTGTRRVIRYAQPLPPNYTLAISDTLSTANTTLTGLSDVFQQTTRTNLDNAGRVSSVTQAEGSSDAVTEYYGYDAADNKTRFTNARGSALGEAAYTWDYTYDANGNLLTEVTPNVDVHTVSANASTITVSSAVATRITTRFEYDHLGNVTSKYDAYGHAQQRLTRYEYDALGRQVRTYFPVVPVYNPATGDTDYGAGGVIGPNETTPSSLYTETWYDALGNAYRSRDVTGNYGYKTYDRMGRVQYEIGARVEGASASWNQNYVTLHVYDAFGNQTGLTRYVNALAAQPSTTAASLKSSQISVTASTADRTISTTYDRRNLAAQVTQASLANNFWRAANVTSGSLFTDAATSYTTYNAFGEAVRSWSRVSSTATADTYSYYDRRGYKTAQISPLSYLTEYKYDASGDLVEQKEFARAITGAYDIRTYAAAPPTPYTLGVGAAGTEQGFDRTTTFTYDVLNRRKSVAEQNVEYSGYNGQLLERNFATLTTSFAYDALGNQIIATDALNNTTYTYYDVLGRTIATVAPGRTVETGSTVRPATRFFRDAQGNVVQQIEYKLDVTGTLVNNVLPTFNSDSQNDRVTKMQYDMQGRVIRTEDANGVDRFTSYYADGALAKEWMVVHNLLDPLTTADDRHESLVTIYKYDALGQQIETKSPVSLDGGQVIRNTRTVYNSFGEIVTKGTVDALNLSPNGDQEFFDYDVTGRIWRTNSGDGVTRIMLYDLAGNATVEFRSQSVNLRAYGTLADFFIAYNLNPSAFMRTETVYNALGSVIERYTPTYRINNYGLPAAAPDVLIGTVSGSPVAGHVYLYWLGTDLTTTAFEYCPPNGSWTTAPVVALPGGYLGVDVHALRNQDYQYRISIRRAYQVANLAETSGTFRVNISQTIAVSSITQGSLTDADSIGTLAIVSTAPQATNSTTFDTAYWSQPAQGASFQWVGGNVVHATFASVGLSSVRAIIQFYRKTTGSGQGSFVTFDGVVGTATNQAEIHVSPGSPYFTASEGGIYSVYRVQIFTADGATLLRDSRPDLAPVGLVWAAPTDQTVTAVFRYKRSIDSTYSTDVSVTRLGAQFALNVFPLLTQNTTYDYQVEYRRAGVVIAKKTGQMTSNGEVVSHSYAGTVSSTATDGFNQAVATPTIAGLTMSWAPPTDNLDPTFEAAYAFNATFEWGTSTAYGNTNITVNRPGSGNWSVNLTGIPTPSATTTYYYRTRYTIGGRVVAEQVGNFQISAPNTSTSITANSNGPQPTVVPAVATVVGSSSILPATTSFNTASWTQPAPGASFQWVGGNVVHATFASVGLSSVRAIIQFYRKTTGSGQGSFVTFDGVVGTATNQAEIHVSPGSPYFTASEGGIYSVYRVQIFTADGATLLRDSQASGGTAGPPKLTWNAPDPTLNLTARITLNGSTTVLTPSSGVFTYSLGSLNGAFSYRIEYLRPGDTTAIVEQSGTVTTDTVSCSVSNVSAINRNPTWITVSSSGASLSWSQAAQTAGDVSFRYRQVGSGTWLTDLSPPASTGPNFSISFPNAAAGTTQYEYEVRYIRSGETLPYVYSTGTATVVRTSNTSSGAFGSKTDTVSRMQPVSVDATLTGNLFRWNYALASGSSVTFRYRINGGTENSVTYNSGGPQFEVALASLPVGSSTVTWWIEYRYSGQAPYAAAYGSVAASHTATTTPANSITNLTQNNQYPSVFQIATPVIVGNGNLGWSTATLANTTATVRYRINGGSWQTTSSGFTAYGSGVQRQFTEAGSYEYELTYQQSGQSTPYAKTNGTFAVAVSDNAPSLTTRTIDPLRSQGLFVGPPRIEPTPTPSSDPSAIWSTVAAPITYYIPIVSASPNSYRQDTASSAAGPGTYTAVTGQTVLIHAQLKWAVNASVDTTMVFEYRVLGSTGAYTRIWVYLLNGGDTLGVDIDPLVANTYEYRLNYTRSGAAAPYATATGRFVRGTGLLDNSVTVDAAPAIVVQDASPVMKQSFDRWGNVLQVQDQAAQLTNYRYDQRNQLVTLTAPTMTYLDTRVSVATTLPSARPVSYNYYDKLGRVIATRDPNGNETRLVYNAAGQMTSRQNADSADYTGGAFVYNTYNTFGNLVQVEDEIHFRTRTIYDKRNQATEVWREIVANTMPTWSAISPEATMQRHMFTYDEAGRRIIEVNGENEVLRYGYDLAGNLSLRLAPGGGRTKFTFDVHGTKATEIQLLETVSPTVDIHTRQDWTYDYFGRLQDHIGMRLMNSTDTTKWGTGLGTDYYYHYNSAGQLDRQTSSRGQDITYVFDGAGQVTLILDGAAKRRTDYTYDSAGRRIRERVTVDNLVHQDTRITYDSQGRMATLEDPDYRVSYSYDLAGNRTLIRSDYVNFAQGNISESLYYTYDQMNRVKISQGMLNPATREVQVVVPSVGYQGYRLVYNARGDRIKMTQRGNKWVQNGNVWSAPWPIGVLEEFSEYYKYDGLGRLLKVEVDRADGGKQTRNEYTLDREGRVKFEWTYAIILKNLESTGYLEARRVDSLYDADGRVSSQTNWKKKYEQSEGSYNRESLVTMGYSSYADHYGNSALEWGPGYDLAGNLRGYDVKVFGSGSSYTTHSTFTFDLGDSFLTKTENATSTGDEPRPSDGLVTRYYDANEQLVAAIDSIGTQKSRAFVNNQGGQTLTTYQGVVKAPPDPNQATWSGAVAYASRGSLSGAPKAQHYFYANDQVVGSVGALQHNPQQHWRGNFDVNYTPVSSEYPGTQPQFVVALNGDTLRTIAARVYGDGNLWYILADENALSSADELLPEGMSIRVPNSIVSLSNNGSVFKPYDPSKVIGDLTPTQPVPPPPRMTACQFLALIVVIIVTVVVAYYTGVWVGPYLGSGFLAAAGAAAIGGAVGSAVGQGVGMLLGLQDEFDWKQVATAAVLGFVTGGLTGFDMPAGTEDLAGLFDELGTMGAFGKGAAGVISKITGVLGKSFQPVLQAGLKAAAVGAISQRLLVVADLKDEFSWRDVAATTVGAMVSAGVGEGLDHFGIKAPQLLRNTLSGFAGGVASAVVKGGKIGYANIAADAFGNALANEFTTVIDEVIAQKQTASGPVDEKVVAIIAPPPLKEIERINRANSSDETSTSSASSASSKSSEGITPAKVTDPESGEPLSTIVVEGRAHPSILALDPYFMGQLIVDDRPFGKAAGRRWTLHNRFVEEHMGTLAGENLTFTYAYNSVRGFKDESQLAMEAEGWDALEDAKAILANPADREAMATLAGIDVDDLTDTTTSLAQKLLLLSEGTKRSLEVSYEIGRHTMAVGMGHYSGSLESRFLDLYEKDFQDAGSLSWFAAAANGTPVGLSMIESLRPELQKDVNSVALAAYAGLLPRNTIGEVEALATDTLFGAYAEHITPLIANPLTRGIRRLPGVKKLLNRSNAVLEEALKRSLARSSALLNGFKSKVSYLRPSGYRKGVRDKVWAAAVKASPDGIVRDPLTKRVMSKNDPWDMGHLPGQEFRRLRADAERQGLTRKQFLDMHNDPKKYRPELPASNRGHALEDMSDD